MKERTYSAAEYQAAKDLLIECETRAADVRKAVRLAVAMLSTMAREPDVWCKPPVARQLADELSAALEPKAAPPAPATRKPYVAPKLSPLPVDHPARAAMASIAKAPTGAPARAIDGKCRMCGQDEHAPFPHGCPGGGA